MLNKTQVLEAYDKARTQWRSSLGRRQGTDFMMLFAKQIEAAVILDKTSQLEQLGKAMAEFVAEERG